MPHQVTQNARWRQSFLKRSGIVLFMCLLIGGMINFFSPTVTWNLDPDYRLQFWIILCLVGGAGIILCDLLLEWTSSTWHVALKSLLQTFCGTIAVLIPLYIIYDPQELPSVQRTVLFVWALMGLIVAGAMSLTHMFLPSSAPAQATEHNFSGRPKILSRLPIHLQNAELYALSAEDHYVRVHTSNGDDILLMRLSDSIDETHGVDGIQTHRSWWVAKDAVSDIKKRKRSAEITLKNGKIAPVSRNALKTLRDIGWI